MPGLYAYCTEYPEDGAWFLGATEVDFDLHKNRRAARTTGEPVAMPHCSYCASMGYQSCAHLAPTTESAAAPADLGAILDCYSPDDTIGDYQDKIRALFAKSRAAEGAAPSERKPLTVEQTLLLVANHTGKRVSLSLIDLDQHIEFAKAIEQHHGTGSAK